MPEEEEEEEAMDTTLDLLQLKEFLFKRMNIESVPAF